jgi:5-methylcytosine-specific restriction endonuclease McrA
MSRATTRLCCEPACGRVLVDALAGARCDEHRSTDWDRWRASSPPEKSSGYGAKWTRLRAKLIAERGEICQRCGAPGPVEAHHVDRLGMTGPRAYDALNILLLCHACHVSAGRRRQVAQRRAFAVRDRRS